MLFYHIKCFIATNMYQFSSNSQEKKCLIFNKKIIGPRITVLMIFYIKCFTVTKVNLVQILEKKNVIFLTKKKDSC